MPLIRPLYENSPLVSIVNKINKKERKTNDFERKVMMYNHKTIVVKQSNLIDVINLSDIVFIQSSSNYSTIYLKNDKKITTSKTLKYWESEIDDNYFIRCHHSYLINYNFIKTIDIRKNEIMMMDFLVPISRSKKAQLLSYF